MILVAQTKNFKTQFTSTHFNSLQLTSTHFNSLQLTSTHFNSQYYGPSKKELVSLS